MKSTVSIKSPTKLEKLPQLVAPTATVTANVDSENNVENENKKKLADEAARINAEASKIIYIIYLLSYFNIYLHLTFYPG